ncbi:MAG: GntR family transcriptional regulator [Hyphomicrobiales bacterium]|nr:GntR family transcriptional regulator [Hyphomicrobiales bacterium]
MSGKTSPKAHPVKKERKPRARNAPPPVERYTHALRTAKNSEVVYRDLRNDIVAMRLTPGSPIVEKALTERYGISRTPVREAVLRLTEERLVDVIPKSGTFVARIPVSIVREALVARRALEEVTVRKAVKRATASQLMEIREIIQRQQEMADAGDEEAFYRADKDFHAAIAAAGRHPGIWEMIQQIRIQVERYRMLTLPQHGRMERVVNEHVGILDAIVDRDAEMAVSLLNDHLDTLRLEITVFRDLWPNYFIYDPAVDNEANDD